MMLLNVCCAPCSLPIIEQLPGDGKVSLFFYGPNIYPEEEYEKRLRETRKVASLYELELFEGDHDHEAWEAFIRWSLAESPEFYPENGERCLACFQYRLQKTAAFAKEKGYGEFAATLSVSRFKDTDFINQYGQWLAAKNDLKYRPFPLDANEAHRLGMRLSQKHGIYRQKYCGCEFSLRA